MNRAHAGFGKVIKHLWICAKASQARGELTCYGSGRVGAPNQRRVHEEQENHAADVQIQVEALRKNEEEDNVNQKHRVVAQEHDGDETSRVALFNLSLNLSSGYKGQAKRRSVMAISLANLYEFLIRSGDCRVHEAERSRFNYVVNIVIRDVQLEVGASTRRVGKAPSKASVKKGFEQ